MNRLRDGIVFRQPTEGMGWKWWRVELRFDRPLTDREVRRVSWLLQSDHNDNRVGADGVVFELWPNSYPTGHDARPLLAAVRLVHAAAVIRAAPLGRDCSATTGCGSKGCGCGPTFGGADTTRVLSHGEPEGYMPCRACAGSRFGDVYYRCPKCDSSGWVPKPTFVGRRPPSPSRGD